MLGYVYRVKVLIYLYLWYISNEGLEFRVQCMICFILMQNTIIIMSKLVKLAFCLCCGLTDPSNVGVAVGIRQLILQHSLNC